MLVLIMILAVILLMAALYVSFRNNKENFDTSLANKGSPLGSTEKTIYKHI